MADDVEQAVAAGTLDEQLRAFIDGLVRRMESVPKSLAALTMRHAVAGDHPTGVRPSATSSSSTTS